MAFWDSYNFLKKRKNTMADYQTLGDKDAEDFKRSFVPTLPRPKIGKNLGARILFAPWNLDNGPNLWESIVSFFLEFFWSFMLGFAVASARRYASLSTINGIDHGVFIGLTHGGVFLIAYIWSNDFGLKRHLNWGVSLGRFLKFFYKFQGTDVGLIALALYIGVQLLGALVGGAVLGAYGLGTIPNTSGFPIGSSPPAMITPPTTLAAWFTEFLGAGFIVLAVVYTDLLHQKYDDSSMSVRKETEYQNNLRVGCITALTIVVVTTMFYPLGSYSFGNVPYFAGVLGLGIPLTSANTNPPGTLFNGDAAHYMFTPLAAGLVFSILGYLLAWLSEANMLQRNPDMERRMYVSRSVATPLTQRLIPETRSTGAKLRVNAFGQ